MSSKRILQVITRSDWGGAPRIVESLATQIDEVTAVACGPGGRLISRLETADVPVHVQPRLQSSPHPDDFRAYRELRALIATGDFDLVHSHSTKAGALARIAATRVGLPTVFTVHGWGFYNTSYRPLRPLFIAGERFLARRTDQIVCVSKNDYRTGKQQGIIQGNNGTVIHNGISPIEPPDNRTTLYEVLEIPPDTPIVGAIARLVPQKDPLTMLATVKKLYDRGHEFATVLIGGGPLDEDCNAFIDKHGLEDVHMTGHLEDAPELLPDYDIFLLPSRFEGFPLTVLECLHAGVPVVANDVGGVGEAIDNRITGFTVPTYTETDSFTDRVESLLNSPQLQRHMGYRARQIAKRLFTETKMINQYRELYRSLLR